MSEIRLTGDLLGLYFFLVGFLSVRRRILSLGRTPVDLGPRGTINDDLNGMESADFPCLSYSGCEGEHPADNSSNGKSAEFVRARFGRAANYLSGPENSIPVAQRRFITLELEIGDEPIRIDRKSRPGN